MTEQQIRDELAALEHEREAFIKEVNEQIVFRNGEINALRRLLAGIQAPTKNAGPPSAEAEQSGIEAAEPTVPAADMPTE